MKYSTLHLTEAAFNLIKDKHAKPGFALTQDNGVVHLMPIVQHNGKILYTAQSKITPYKVDAFGENVNYLSDESEFDETTGKGIMKFDSDVTMIGAYAFVSCSGLTSIEIPNSVISIGANAFGNCSGLTSVTIPNSVINIGDGAFYGCSGLTSVTIPDSVTSIRNQAFDNCVSLTSINVETNNPNYCSINGVLFNKNQTTLIQYPCGKQGAYSIPSSVTSIGRSAFDNCINLTSVTIDNSVESIGEWAFNNCRSLTSVIIPDSVTSIENYTFNNCRSLTSIKIPNSVTNIGIQAFWHCIGLTSVTIGNNIISIGESAFGGCIGLNSITCKATNPPTLGNSDVFDNTNNCYIYVPVNSVDRYKAAEYWSEYTDRIQPMSE